MCRNAFNRPVCRLRPRVVHDRGQRLAGVTLGLRRHPARVPAQLGAKTVADLAFGAGALTSSEDKTGFHYYHFHRQNPHSTALLALLFRWRHEEVIISLHSEMNSLL
eukprot:s2636_g4.t1